MNKFTKIVATLGPSSNDKETIEKLYNAGMNVCRINFSHGSHEYALDLIKKIREIDENIAILLDTKGPEVRTGEVENGLIILEDRQKIEFTKEIVVGSKDIVTINYHKLEKVDVKNKIFIDDGLIECEVIDKTKTGIICRVLNGGELGSKKSVTIWGHNVDLPFLSQKDIDDIEFGIKHNVAFIAASFVRTAGEVKEIRKILDKHNSKIHIISKIEHSKSVENFDAILEVSDGIMVARGDLGVEMPLEKVPQYQREMIRKSRFAGKPVIVATQMLESMKSHPRPTRAEVTDVAQAIMQGTDAVMLSGETANGKYPVKAVQMMAKIANEYEHRIFSHLGTEQKTVSDISLFIAEATYEASRHLKTKAILIPTESGFTARNVSRYRPNCMIYASSRDIVVVRQMQLCWGVYPFHHNVEHKCRDDMINNLVMNVFTNKFVSKKDKVVVTAGFKLAQKGYTNLMEIYEVGEIIDRIDESSCEIKD